MARLLLAALAAGLATVASAARTYIRAPVLDKHARLDVARHMPGGGYTPPDLRGLKKGSTAASAFCQPGQPCWPTSAQWAALNATVGGRLIAVTPYGAPCYLDPAGAACAAVVNGFTDPAWRRDQPGAMQAPNWEQGPDGRGCFDPSSPPCSPGAMSPFAVAPATDAHVAAALAFAAVHGLQPMPKATGHEYQGRSAGAGSLQVWLRSLRGIVVDPAFSTGCPGAVAQPAVTTRPGDGWGDVYDAVDAAGFAVVGGSARTVSSAGGYTLSGGHSFLSPSHGLAVDNLLAATVVLANGSALGAVSACAHPDLFWALRGGGAGAAGAVMTSATYALHPVGPVTGLEVVVALLQPGTASSGPLLDAFLELSANWTDGASSPDGGVWAGYWSLDAAQSYFSATLMYNGSTAAATASAGEMAAWVKAQVGLLQLLTFSLAGYPTSKAWHDTIDPPATGDRTGSPATLGSRLIPREYGLNATKRAYAAYAMATVAAYGVPLSGMMTVGGAVAAADPDSAATSVTTAWRSAIQHVALGLGWALNATLAEQTTVFEAVYNVTSILRYYVPDGSGAYFSESDYAEPAWEEAFWGAANYARLQRVKAAFDPAGALQCHHCVQLPVTGA